MLLRVHTTHHGVKAIDATRRLPINLIGESFVAVADYTGTVSGATVNKSKPILFEIPTYKYLHTGDEVGNCMKTGIAIGQTVNT